MEIFLMKLKILSVIEKKKTNVTNPNNNTNMNTANNSKLNSSMARKTNTINFDENKSYELELLGPDL